MTQIHQREVRYIKLGAGGRWAPASFEQAEIQFGYPRVPHEPCLAGDWEAVTRLLVEREGRTLSKARDRVREIRDFYTLGRDCLWVTFADGHLWWAFADPEVVWRGADKPGQPARLRRTLDGWRNTNILGAPLRVDVLSSRLTKVAAYRQTICKISATDHLLRRINGLEEPMVARAREAREAMVAIASEMIAALHWAEFETLVDLIFGRTGWQRTSRVGGAQADVDLVLEQASTGETAFVQVKSKAGQAVLDDYAARFRRSGAYDRMFFICHSPRRSLSANGDDRLHVWAGDRLAEAAVRAGLFEWLIERSA